MVHLDPSVVKPMILEGKSARGIAKALGVSAVVVVKFVAKELPTLVTTLKDNGNFLRGGRGHKNRKLYNKTAILKSYTDGQRPSAIAVQEGISEPTVYKVLRDGGLMSEPVSGPSRSAYARW